MKTAHLQKKPLVAITGASAGIGEATARIFAQNGYRVLLLARRKEALDLLQKELGDGAFSFKLDVTDAKEVASLFHAIEQQFGPIDILVNNAGMALGLEPAFECSLEDWKQCVDVNINGVLNCTHAVLPVMARENRGHIINLGSIAGTYPYPGGHVYGATKAFIHQFTLNLRADLVAKGKTGVRATCIEPGLVSGTEFSLVRFRGDRERAKGVHAGTTALTPEDIATLIFFCASLPPHVTINTLEVMPTGQASSALTIERK